MLWIALVITFLLFVGNILVYLTNLISDYRSYYLHAGCSVLVGYEEYGTKSLRLLGLMLLIILLIIILYKTTKKKSETVPYKVADNSNCTYQFGFLVDTIRFSYVSEGMVKSRFVNCRRENVTIEYDYEEPFVEVTYKYREGSLLANVMVLSFMDRDVFCKVNMPEERINFMR